MHSICKLINKTYNYQDEWCSGNDSPLNASLNHLLPAQKNIPMPTLYSTSEGQSRKPAKTSITQMVFYNVASILASVAAGYDVRMSNVSPVHPKLQPNAMLNGSEENGDSDRYAESGSRGRNEYGTPQRTFPHNTYHGPTKHVR